VAALRADVVDLECRGTNCAASSSWGVSWLRRRSQSGAGGNRAGGLCLCRGADQFGGDLVGLSVLVPHDKRTVYAHGSDWLTNVTTIPKKLALESAWQRKADEVITLSKAFGGRTLARDGSPDDRGVPVSSGLHARTEHAYDELAAIEDAIARIDDGTYGMCGGCGQAMPDEWLADKPEVRYCPDCSLRLVNCGQPD
jgi:DnaK suppressor protein